MDRDIIFKKYEKYLNKFGFGDYMIDFSDVTNENMTKLCEFIKTTLKKDKQNE